MTGKLTLTPLPPKEAIAYFEQKGYAIGFNWQDVWQAEHQGSFTVVKVMQQDILEDIRKEVARALAEGTTLETFAKNLTPTLQEKGWWGKKAMVDPLTGEEQVVQLGSPRRLKVIYDTNLRTAHSEGQWERIQETKDTFPYLEYDGKNSEHSRLTHGQWDKLVLPVDDPFWQAHFPVKEYGCKCRVIPRMARQLERQGKTVDTAPTVPTRAFVNKRTGEVQQVPQGVHPSFHYPPGGRRASMNQHLIEKLESAPPSLSRASVADLASGPAAQAWVNAPAGDFPIAHLGKRVSAKQGATTQLAVIPERTLADPQASQVPPSSSYDWIQKTIDEGVESQNPQRATVTYTLEESGHLMVVELRRSGKVVTVDRFLRVPADASGGYTIPTPPGKA